MSARNLTVLGLDLGTATGWAYRAGGKEFSGTWSLRPRSGEPAGLRFWRLEDRLERLREQLGHIDRIGFEQVNFAGRDAAGQTMVRSTQVWAGYLAVLYCFCERHGIPYRGVATNTLKKSATGNGRATKEAMMRMFRLRLGREPKDDNEADAYHVLDWAVNCWESGPWG